MKCLCGFEATAMRMLFRAIMAHRISRRFSECDYPDEVIELYVCPEY
jgi:hypothetical protein